ncbi:MAG: YraN family protein [Pseudomonadales bacterium]
MQGKLANLIKGSDAESRAAKLLRSHGFKIIEKNKSYKFGELDIIAEKNGQRLFVEVKYRGSSRFGVASEFVDKRKQQRLIKAALRWIQERDPQMLFSYRFDVIAIQDNTDQPQNISWIENAFEGTF